MEQLKVFDEKFQNLIKDGVHTLSFLKDVIEETIPTHNDWSASDSNNLSCSYCRIEFKEPAQHREHYKLDWHRYNLKQNLLSREPVTEEQFNEQTDDVSSISGSESEEETLDTIVTAQGKVFLKNNNGKIFGLYKSLLVGKKTEIDSDLLLQVLQQFQENNQWTVLMLGGGHFAGAVFQGDNPILHKTFHCYTVRAGQGGAQSSKDNQSASSQPKSAGASLRRYNEMSLVQHVKDIVELWKPEIAKSSLIIYRAAGPTNRSVLFGGKTPLLDRTDPRLRTVPFSTRRATFTEAKRVHSIMTTVFVYDSIESASKQIINTDLDPKRPRTKTTIINRAKSRESTERSLPAPADSTTIQENQASNKIIKSNKHKTTQSYEDEASDESVELSEQELVYNNHEIIFSESLQTFDDSLTMEERNLPQKKKKKPKKSKNQIMRNREIQRKKNVYDIVSNGDINALKLILDSLKIVDDGIDEAAAVITSEMAVNESLTEGGDTLLHIAASHEQGTMIEFLLERNADPCSKNVSNQSPYTCTTNKDIREVFKQFAKENPDKYNYNKANIPVSTITPEEFAEKKRAKRKMKREKEKEKKKLEDVRKEEALEMERFLRLSDREKSAIAAERRMLNKQGLVVVRCFMCAGDMTGKVPFEYQGYKFCSIDCLKNHRTQHNFTLS